MKISSGPKQNQNGFSLVELLVVMVVSLVLLTGLFGNYLLELRVNRAQSTITERLADLRLISQLIRQELRQATSVTWDAGQKELSYTTVDGATGLFKYQESANDRIGWQRPGETGYVELVRGLDQTNGLAYAVNGDVVIITLKPAYNNLNNEEKNMTFTFKVWPRN